MFEVSEKAQEMIRKTLEYREAKKIPVRWFMRRKLL